MGKKLSDIVAVKPRYSRSVSLLRDWRREHALDGYILTPSGRGILRRISAALSADVTVRAWSITGPYGSGKSAFALFAAQLLGGLGTARQQAGASLKIEEPELQQALFGRQGILRGGKRILPVLVVGSREPLHLSVLNGLEAALCDVKPTALTRAIKKQIAILQAKRKSPTTSEVVALIEKVVAMSAADPKLTGVMLIVDELGKSLEFAATSPEADIFLLQAIAEFAAGSRVPFLVLTILHQSVERYAEQLSGTRRNEWAKVHGRFEDIAFDESSDQVLRLIASAIERADCPEANDMGKASNRLSEEAWLLGTRCGNANKREFIHVLSDCGPLHPLTAILLGPLFRRLAQNERSLFAFLTSGEPFGFQDFLRSSRFLDRECEFLRLDRVYDYVTSALGSSLFTQHRGKQWAEVESALERLADAPPIEVKVAKVIGLLQAIGFAAGIAASRAVLKLALSDKTHKAADIDKAVSALEHKGVIIYRRHADSYALWEGSDIDIDAHVRAARGKVDSGRRLASYLTELSPLRPLVARRHSFCTGTLRYFDACYAEATSLDEVVSRDFGGADGRIIFCIPTSADETKEFEKALTGGPIAAKAGVIAVLPHGLSELNEACVELACLNWIRNNTPELASDATARRELRARIAAAGELVAGHVALSFSPNKAEQSCRWYHRGRRINLRNERMLHELLSTVCDELYSSTPIWKNELANRRILSSSAAKARRNLIEAMLERPDQEYLGIEGTPPERSMYDSLLRAPSLHRQHGGKWLFGPPSRKGDAGLADVWKAVNNFLHSCEAQKRSVADLFDILQRPPFGLKQGVLPILFATVMIVYDSEVALYETGSFVPLLTTAVFERMLKLPRDFEIQQCKVVGPRAAVFSQYAAAVSVPQEKGRVGKAKVLGIVRPLFRFFRRLPDFVGNTQQISDTAKGVLRAIKETKEPDQLLFRDLPIACGATPFGTKGRPKRNDIDRFFSTFRGALSELQQAYPKLQATVEELLIDAFKLGRPLVSARRELSHRCKLIAELAVDSKLRSFVFRATDTVLEDSAWLEGIAALLGERPTTTWTDHDRVKFEVNLAIVARKFRHFEVLAFELERSGTAILDGDATALRFAVTTPMAEEIERVVRIPSQMKGRVQDAQTRIRQVLADMDFLRDNDLSVAILADFSRQLLVEHP